MKRILLTITALLALAPLAAAQDTVDMYDEWYLYYHPECHVFDHWTDFYTTPYPYLNLYMYQHDFPELVYADWFTISKFYPPKDGDSLIYGIALTADNFPLGRHAPYLGLYNHGYHDWYGSWSSIRLVDSLSILDPRKECVFRYDLDALTPVQSHNVSCYEFYFPHPYPIDSLTDSFYVGLIWPEERRGAYTDMTETWDDSSRFRPFYILPRVIMNYPDVTHEDVFRCECTTFIGGSAYIDYEYYSEDSIVALHWTHPEFGPVFPIIKLRCTAPRAWVAERGEGTATVGWRASEAGELYQASLAPYGTVADSGLLVTTADTFYTFGGLASDTALYSLHVRKACRYTTSGYDTLVWSDWSAVVTFRLAEDDTTGVEGIREAEGVAFALRPNPARGAVQVSLPAEAAGGRLSLCDLQGRELEALAVTGPTAELDVSRRPAGVYLVKLVTALGVSSRRLLVE